MTDLTTVDAVCAWLEQETGQGTNIATADGNLIGSMIAATTAWFEGEAGRTFGAASFSETYDGKGGRVLRLRNTPIIEIMSVTINGRAIPAGSSQTGGWYNDSKRLLLTDYAFAPGFANVAVSYQAGFETIPSDLAQAATELVATIYRSRAHIGLSAQTLASQVTSYLNEALPLRVRQTLDRYKRVTPA